MILDKSGYLKILQENIATVIRNDTSASTDDIDAKLLELQKELLQKPIVIKARTPPDRNGRRAFLFLFWHKCHNVNRHVFATDAYCMFFHIRRIFYELI